MLGLSILLHINLFAQQMVNPGFIPGLNNDPQVTNCSGSFANGGGVPNWHKTHGTPRFINDCNGADAEGNFLYMAAGRSNSTLTGEGIAGNYEFKAGVKYLIQISICNTYQFIDPSQGLVVSATSVLPQNLPPAGPPSAQCLTAVPGVNPVDIETIRILDAVNPPAIATNNLISIYFTFTPQANRKYIWLYPAIFPGSYVSTCNITIAQVQIFPECQDLLVFNNGQLGHIPPGVHAGYRHIIAGSQSGPNPPVPVTIDPDSHTELLARSSILLENNFLATANDGGSFIARIDDFTCLDYVSEEPLVIGGGSGKPANNKISKENLAEYNSNSEFSQSNNSVKDGVHDKVLSKYYHPKVYPNPSNGAFNIDIPSMGNYNVKIIDMMGTTVYNKVISGNSQTKINQQNELAQGNYIIRITGEGIKHVEKISVIR